jgi:hypothetical protein
MLSYRFMYLCLQPFLSSHLKDLENSALTIDCVFTFSPYAVQDTCLLDTLLALLRPHLLHLVVVGRVL